MRVVHKLPVTYSFVILYPQPIFFLLFGNLISYLSSCVVSFLLGYRSRWPNGLS